MVDDVPDLSAYLSHLAQTHEERKDTLVDAKLGDR
jgi:hypothetical protein